MGVGGAWGAKTGIEFLAWLGRVTVSIPARGPGEVLLPVRGGSETFAAWADEAIARHSRVVVVDVLSARSVSVMPHGGPVTLPVKLHGWRNLVFLACSRS